MGAVVVDRGDRLTAAACERRSNRLARALASLGVGRGDRVVICCCDRHAPDVLVAWLAAGKLAADACVVDPAAIDGAACGRPRVVLTCAEGGPAWRASGAGGLVVGDEPGTVWWKALELHHSSAPLNGAVALLADVAGEPRVVLLGAPVSHRAGLRAALTAIAAGSLVLVQAPFEPDRFRALLGKASAACLLPEQAAQLPADGDWVTRSDGLRWWTKAHAGAEVRAGLFAIAGA